MASSRFLVATRAFVKVLLALARTYELALQVNRESSAEQLVKAYKKVLLKAHPDKGGRKEDVQKLQEVKETWEKARKEKEPRPQGGRPKATTQVGTLVTRRARKDYRVHTEVVLLTYSNFSDLQQWHSRHESRSRMFFPFACVRVPKCADEIVMTCPTIVKGPRANHAFSEVIHSMCPDQNIN